MRGVAKGMRWADEGRDIGMDGSDENRTDGRELAVMTAVVKKVAVAMRDRGESRETPQRK